MIYVYREGLGVIPKEDAPPRKGGLQIIRDIDPYVSPIDGSVIGSRREIREHEKRHDVVLVGNDMPPPKNPGPRGYPEGFYFTDMKD